MSNAAPSRQETTYGWSVMVFSDITKLRMLENHRRDFVANVSHESDPIDGDSRVLETLMNTRIEDSRQRQEFLQIANKHVSRLNLIVDDLLSISKVEDETESQRIERRTQLIRPICESALEICRDKANAHGSEIKLDAPSNLQAHVNEPLLESALVNLLENAIKYGGERIQIRAGGQKRYVMVMVSDNGSGIESIHLPRIFERFYRVDKARSRKLGGTGLGLSIVKHNLASQGASIAVRSGKDMGAHFTITLQKATPAAAQQRDPRVDHERENFGCE